MLINLRNALMTGKKSPLPPGARWVEYLQSTGTQWIDTGVYGSNAVKATLDFQLISLGSGYGVFGAYTSTSSSLFAYQAGGGNGVWQIGFGYYNNTTKKTDTERHNIEFNDFHVDIDGATIVTFPQHQFMTSHTMTIFTTRDETGGVYRATRSRCYGSRIWQSNTLVRDFRPIAIGTTGYMLDLVSGEYLPYGNKGTGDFTIGPNINAPV
jgi:hypothetical protein